MIPPRTDRNGTRGGRRAGARFRLPLTVALLCLLGPVPSACGGEASEELKETARKGAAERRQASAEAAFRELSFDTVQWDSPRERTWRGEVVYRHSCQECHGPDGTGDGPRAGEERLDVPPVGGPEWLYAGDVPEIRHRIFVGHGPAMPTWGLAGLSARDVDAVAHYLGSVPGRDTASGEED